MKFPHLSVPFESGPQNLHSTSITLVLTVSTSVIEVLLLSKLYCQNVLEPLWAPNEWHQLHRWEWRLLSVYMFCLVFLRCIQCHVIDLTLDAPKIICRRRIKPRSLNEWGAQTDRQTLTDETTVLILSLRRVAAALPGMESSDAASGGGGGEKPQNYREVVLNDDKLPDQHMSEGGCSC